MMASCNFIKDFVIIAAPLFWHIRKTLHTDGDNSPRMILRPSSSSKTRHCLNLSRHLRVDQKYTLIADAATGTADSPR
jgi:hypothetical protein